MEYLENKQQQEASIASSNIAELVRREIALQKQLDSEQSDSLPGIDEVVKIGESFAVKGPSLFTPSGF